MDPGLHRAQLRRGDARDLVVVEPFHVAQDYHGALLRGQARERGLDMAHRLAVRGQVLELRPACDGLGPRLLGGLIGLERQLTAPAPRADDVDRAVRRDAEEPRAERRPLEGADGPPRGDAGVLHDVLRLRPRTEDPRDVRVDALGMLGEQRLERARIAAARFLDARVAWLVGHWS